MIKNNQICPDKRKTRFQTNANVLRAAFTMTKSSCPQISLRGDVIFRRRVAVVDRVQPQEGVGPLR